jgi:hypothetical protein
MGFMAMSTNATILATATMDRCRHAGSTRSTVFRQTRRTTSMATQVIPRMTEAASTAPDFREEGVPVVGAVTPVVAAVTAKAIGFAKGPLTSGPFNWANLA